MILLDNTEWSFLNLEDIHTLAGPSLVSQYVGSPEDDKKLNNQTLDILVSYELATASAHKP